MSVFISEGLARRGIPNSFLLDDFFVTEHSVEAIQRTLIEVNTYVRSLGLPVQDRKVEYGQQLTLSILVY